MTKILILLGVLTSFNLIASDEDFSNYTCTIDESGESTIFNCLNKTKIDSSAWFLEEGDKSFTYEVQPLLAKEMKEELIEKGVKFIDPLSFTAISFFETVKALNEQKVGRDALCYQEVGYTSKEFTALKESHSTVVRLKKLAEALKEAGICNIPVKSNNTNHKIGVSNNDELLEHFLCISNSESTFGKTNIGMGGRGPWGIHPMHNQKKGTKAFVDGRTVTLKKNQLCYPSIAVVRHSNGSENKSNEAYQQYDVQVANAQCALKLYQQSGYLPWGKGSSWGSNRHCSRSEKNRFEFKKYLKEAVCCSESCKKKLSGSI